MKRGHKRAGQHGEFPLPCQEAGVDHADPRQDRGHDRQLEDEPENHDQPQVEVDVGGEVKPAQAGLITNECPKLRPHPRLRPLPSHRDRSLPWVMQLASAAPP